MHTLQRNLSGNFIHKKTKGLSHKGEAFFCAWDILSMGSSIVGRRAVHHSLKITTKMRVRRIMKIFGGIGDGYFGFQQHPGGIVHLEIAVILFWGNADFCFEKAVQIVGLVAGLSTV